MSEAQRVLVVDDEPYLADLVELGLRHAGYSVRQALDGRAALELSARFRPDLIVLDVMLPDIDGFELCRRLRATGDDVPVVFLTARDAAEDTLAGLELGADDYLTKPFSVAELTARVRAVLRRTAPARQASTRLAYADLVLDEESHQVWRGDTEVELTATEFALLRQLLANAGRVQPKDRLLLDVWGYDFGGNANVLETYVSYLRAKLDPLGPPLLQTVRGVGYVLRSAKRASPR